ncbi:MAG: hypothetical protein WKG07_10600 [Hymenobacter sp.]
MGVQTLALYPDTNDTSEMLEAPSLFYSAEIAATRGWPLEDLIQHAMPKHMQAESSPQVQVVLVEFPALRESILPVGVLRQLNLVFLAVPADRPWRLTDHQTVERLRAATPAPVEVVLFGVAPQHRRRGVAARPTALRPLPFPYPVAGSYPMKPSPSLSSVLLNSRWLPLGAVAGALGAGWLVGQSGLLGSASLTARAAAAGLRAARLLLSSRWIYNVYHLLLRGDGHKPAHRRRALRLGNGSAAATHVAGRGLSPVKRIQLALGAK